MASTAFACATPVPQRPTTPASTPRPRRPTCSASGVPATSRRTLLRGLSLAALGLALPRPSRAAAAKADPAREGVEAVAMCLRVLGPVERYVRDGAWDRARTNVNYCSRVLAVRKKMLASADTLAADDAYLTAMEAGAEVANLFTNLDAAVYTAVFIPAEDGVSLEQREYQEAAYRALNESYGYLDAYLGVFDPEMVAAAKENAKTAKYEIRVEAP